MLQKTIYILFGILIINFSNNYAQTVQLDSTILKVDTLIDSLDLPWEIKWGPDNYIYVTEKSGNFSQIDPITGTRKILKDFSEVGLTSFGEGGLLGFTLHPNFLVNKWIYITYHDSTIFTSAFQKISRFELLNDSLLNELIIIDSIPNSPVHNGCRLLFLADTTLLVTTGDAGGLGVPIDTNTLGGKVLRVNDDGSIPLDNPFGNLTYSLGHRNAQGLLILPNGNILSSEHGGMDELNIIEKGKNYGWDRFSGKCDTSSSYNCNMYTDPIYEIGSSVAPSDLIYYNSSNIPELNNKVIMAVLKEKRLISFTMNTSFDSIIDTNHYFVNKFGRIRDILFAPNGDLYLALNGCCYSNTNPYSHSIIKLSFLANTSGLNSEKHISTFSLFPNPTYNTLNINGDINSDLDYSIINVFGNIVKEGKLNVNSIDVSNLTKGKYFLSLTDKQKNIKHYSFIKM